MDSYVWLLSTRDIGANVPLVSHHRSGWLTHRVATGFYKQQNLKLQDLLRPRLINHMTCNSSFLLHSVCQRRSQSQSSVLVRSGEPDSTFWWELLLSIVAILHTLTPGTVECMLTLHLLKWGELKEVQLLSKYHKTKAILLPWDFRQS